MIKITNQKRLLLALMIISSLLMLEAAIPARAMTNNPQVINSDTRSKRFTNQAYQERATLFHEGNSLYQKGEWGKAVQTYRQLTSTGYESGNLYFNLGTAYFKQGHKGLAILYYEKARRFLPFDKDLKTNLNIALTGVDEGEINWGHEFYRILVCLAPLNWLALSSSICFYLLILLIILRILFPARIQNSDTRHIKLWYKMTLSLVSCLLFCLISLTTLGYFDQRQAQAVVIKGNAEALSEPKLQGTVYFHLSEGSRILIKVAKGGWCLIKRQDGKRGWVERQYMGRL